MQSNTVRKKLQILFVAQFIESGVAVLAVADYGTTKMRKVRAYLVGFTRKKPYP